MTPYEHVDFDHHELVAFREDRASGLRAIIALHNTRLGPAVGGCRMFAYPSSDSALSDVLRLSRGMTYKAALAGVPFGGGKSVIIGDPRQDKSRELLLAMAAFVDELGGKYITAEDSGTGVEDMDVIAEKTRHVYGRPVAGQGGGDPSPVTAYGVFCGIQAAVRHQLNSDLRGVRVAIQGVGHVGFCLAEYLVKAGARVRVADINPENCHKAASLPGVSVVSPERVLFEEAEVVAPCALGGAINSTSVEQIRACIVAGSANNQLESPAMGEHLRQRGILYAPDYVINAGGVIAVYYQTQGIEDRQRVNAHVQRIGDTLGRIFQCADGSQQSTSVVADRMAEEIFLAPKRSSEAA